MAMDGKTWAIIAVVLIGGYMLYTGSITLPGSKVVTPTTTQIRQDLDGLCVGVESTTVTLNAFEKFNRGTTDTTSAHRVFVKTNGNGQYVDLGYYQDGASFSSDPGTKYKVIFAENSTTHYPVLVEGEIPCKSNLPISAEIVDWDTSFTLKCWNPDGNIGTLNQTGSQGGYDLGTGDVMETWDCTLQSTSKDGFGISGEKNVLVIEANRAITKLSSSLPSTSVQRAKRPRGGNYDEYAFEFDYIEDLGKVDFTITIESVNSTGIVGTADASVNALNITYFDNCIYQAPLMKVEIIAY